jgi:hypothetical protein
MRIGKILMEVHKAATIPHRREPSTHKMLRRVKPLAGPLRDRLHCPGPAV